MSTPAPANQKPRRNGPGNGPASGNGQKSGGRPDRDNFDKNMNALSEKLKAVKERIAKLRAEVDSHKNQKDPVWADLKNKLTEARKNKDETLKSVREVQAQIKALDASIQKNKKDVAARRPKSGPRTKEECEQAAQQLQARVESGTLSLPDERRTLAEITSMRNLGRQLEGISKIQADIDAQSQEIAVQKAKIDASGLQAYNDEIKEINAKMDARRSQQDSKKQALDAVWERLKSDMDRQRELHAEMDKLRADFNAKRQAFKDEAARAAKDREEEEKQSKIDAVRNKKLREAEAKVEAAREPAFGEQLSKAHALMAFFDPSYKVEAIPETAASSTQSETLGSGRRRQTREISGPQGVALSNAKPVDNATTSRKDRKRMQKAAPAAEKTAESKVRFDMTMLASLASLNISPPTNAEQTEETKAKLLEKIQFYKENNDRVTSERLERAEAELKKVQAEFDTKPAEETPVEP